MPLNQARLDTSRSVNELMTGVDEAGRGPLAGPVAIGVAVVPKDFDWKVIPGVGDSKKVSPKNREAIFRRAKELKKQGKIDYAVSLVSNGTIDRIGITKAVALGIERCFRKLALDPKIPRLSSMAYLKHRMYSKNKKQLLRVMQKKR